MKYHRINVLGEKLIVNPNSRLCHSGRHKTRACLKDFRCGLPHVPAMRIGWDARALANPVTREEEPWFTGLPSLNRLHDTGY
jgi:hypothetical protein